MAFIARTIDNLMAMLLWLFIGLISIKTRYSNQMIYKYSFYCQFIVSAIRVIYTESGKFYYRYLHRFFTISLIIGISGLSFVAILIRNLFQLPTEVSINRFYILDFLVCMVIQSKLLSHNHISQDFTPGSFQWLRSYDDNMHNVNDRCMEKSGA